MNEINENEGGKSGGKSKNEINGVKNGEKSMNENNENREMDTIENKN